MTIYRRKLPHIEKDGRSYFITFHARDDLTLNDEAKWLVLDHCLYDDGKRYELESVVVMSTHVHLILTPLPDGLGYFRFETGARSPQQYPWYWRRGMRKPKRKQKIKDPWLSGE